MTYYKFIIPIAILALLGFLGFNLTNNTVAPNVTFTTITGKKISMADLKGKVVLINFWATDCPGCIKEMPELINIYNTYKTKGFELISVAMPYDPPAQVLNYTTQKSLPFPVMHDGFGDVTKAFGGVNLTPTAFVFDKQGKRLQRTIGELNFAELRQLLNNEIRK